MLRQRIQNRQPNALQGLGLVALVALCVLAGSALFSRLEGRLGALSSALFIAYGCAIAWFLMNWFTMSFVYTANADCLRVCRAYGKRERFVTDVWLNQVLACGTPDEMKRRYPGAHVGRATRPQCPLEPLALAYRDSARTAILVIQPDAPMRAHLLAAVKK